jgi:uncharacterized protein (TIGR03083 family)
VSELPYDPLSVIATDGEGFLAALTGVPHDALVPSCPAWRSIDLIWHLGEVWFFWGTIVRRGVTDVEQLDVVEASKPDGLSADEMVAWASEQHQRLLEALVAADPDQRIWTWTGELQPPSWVARRMALETVVHRWDAERTAGREWPIDPVVASDGVDEFLTWFMGARPDGEPVGGSVHLHCTDTAGEWLVTDVTDEGAVFERVHAKGDCAVRGPAADLLLWIWRRDGGPVEVIGDADLAERFRKAASVE